MGLWHCQFVDQEQSDEEAEEFGDYDDMGMSRQQKAAKTEFAGATLELRDDGTYALQAEDYNSSHGTWTVDGARLALRESEDCTNGYEGLEYSYSSEESFTVAFKLNADSHDGLDVLVLTFGRDQPRARAAASDAFVDRLLSLDDEDEVYELLDELLDGDTDATELARELWDAWVAGTIAADPESDSHWLQTLAFGDERLIESGGFAHAHAKHALETLEYDRDREMFDIVEEVFVHLPKDDDADAVLAPLFRGKWLDTMTASRFMGGGVPEEFFERRLMPQPDADDAARAHLRKGYYTRFEAIEKLYPGGHPDLPAVVLRYRGRGLLDVPQAMIRERGIEAEALASAIAWLEDADNNHASSTGLSMMMHALVLLVAEGSELPPVLTEALSQEIKGMIMGSPSDDEKARLRQLAAELPEDQRKLVHARFWLDAKAG